MNITYTLTLNEYQEAVMHHYKTGKRPLFVAVYLGLATFIMLLGTDFSNTREVITNILMVFFAISFYLLFTRMISAYQAKRVYNKSSLLSQEVTLRVSGKGLTENKKASDKPLAWEHFTKRKENEKYYMLYTNNHQFNVIPKRAMNEKQLKEFNAYLDKYMPNR